MVGEQARGVLPVAGRLGMPDRLDDETLPGIPLGRGQVQPPQRIRLGMAQLEPKEVREQRVVSEPRPRRIDRDHEGVRLLEVEQQPLRPGGPDQAVGERPAHPLDDRGPQQERPDRVGLALQHLGQQVVGDRPLAAGELPDELLGLRVVGERHRGQAQTCRPPLGPGVEQVDRRIGEQDHPEAASSSRVSSSVNRRSDARTSISCPARR